MTPSPGVGEAESSGTLESSINSSRVGGFCSLLCVDGVRITLECSSLCNCSIDAREMLDSCLLKNLSSHGFVRFKI